MDCSEATKIVFNRIQSLEPELVTKIIGYVLLQDHGEREMLRLAFGPDNLLVSLINKAKLELGLSAKPAAPTPISPTSMNSGSISDVPLQFTPFTPASSRPYSSPATFRVASPFWETQMANNQQQMHNLEFLPQGAYADTLGEDYRVHNQGQFPSLDDQLDPANSVGPEFSSNYYFPEHTLNAALGARTSRRSPSLPEFPVKACHYFNKGYCKHGTNCRYFHGQTLPDGFPQIFNPSPNDLGGDDHIYSPGSLEKLEVEITELLKSRRGIPVSIASLPMLYYEKYGRNLQAEGYLTESQRHGKSGHSLTKLLARLKNSIRLIDRPHGQHSVVLAEDASRYMEYRSDRSDPGVIVSGSRQIYLTFPAESTFSEEDVQNYFKIFGPVEDVRIPSQQKRMFGFVTFAHPETVKQILAKGNPHFVCGARVLVKPYREKSRLIDRKYQEKIDPSMYYSTHLLEMDAQLHSLQRLDNSRLLHKQLLEEHEQALELERRRFSDMQLAAKALAQQSYFSYAQLEDVKLTDDHGDFPSAGDFNYLLDVINNGSTSDDKNRHTNNAYNDPERYSKNLFVYIFRRLFHRGQVSLGFFFTLSFFDTLDLAASLLQYPRNQPPREPVCISNCKRHFYSDIEEFKQENDYREIEERAQMPSVVSALQTYHTFLFSVSWSLRSRIQSQAPLASFYTTHFQTSEQPSLFPVGGRRLQRRKRRYRRSFTCNTLHFFFTVMTKARSFLTSFRRKKYVI